MSSTSRGRLRARLQNNWKEARQMPSGACVLRYDGKRGTVWRVKYRDATGRQVKETLGPAGDGWNRRKAEKELRARLTDVEREGRRKIDPVVFKTFAAEWLAT